MKNNYVIERLSDNNFNDLAVIYDSAFGYIPNMAQLKKKFDTSWCSEKNVGFIAYSKENEPAAFYGVFPCVLNKNGKKSLTAQSGDVMTHKDHQRKGLFTLLANKTEILCKDLEIEVLFAFPNQNSYPIFINRLNWELENNVMCYRIDCSPFKLANRSINFFNSNYSILQFKKLISPLLCELDHGFKSIIESNKMVSLERTSDYLSYKTYFEKYYLLIENKVVIVKPSPEYLRIGDIEHCDYNTLGNIISHLKKITYKSGIRYLRLQISKGNNLENYLKNNAEKMTIEYPFIRKILDKKSNIHKQSISLLDYDTF